jgi:hypothetical protein
MGKTIEAKIVVGIFWVLTLFNSLSLDYFFSMFFSAKSLFVSYFDTSKLRRLERNSFLQWVESIISVDSPFVMPAWRDLKTKSCRELARTLKIYTFRSKQQPHTQNLSKVITNSFLKGKKSFIL